MDTGIRHKNKSLSKNIRFDNSDIQRSRGGKTRDAD